MRAWHLIHRVVIALAILALLPVSSSAEPCLLAYPLDFVVFHYDPAEYSVVGVQHPLYDPRFGVAGEMLWNSREQRVAFAIYQAPGLSGFEPSPTGKNQFYTAGNTTTIRIDGFSDVPRQLNDIYVEFSPYPLNSTLDIFINDERIDGLRHVIPRLVVSTPTDDGFYSDSVDLDVRWVGSQFVRITVFADKNGNRVLDGDLCLEVVMEDLTVPTENKTWGSIKSMYRTD
ncbi:MAG: hypothetical protein JSW58_15725 [Candidatus Latescibacterota bacterium]|nr:MAG: hypothetical protein JSW58_15725 [Candidatus Latescibacterota bacterium]